MQVDTYQVRISNGNDFLPTRVSYKLNLKGPSVNVQTACSTSLVAVGLACDSLLNGHCDMALAGGVSISVPQKSGYLYQEGMILSPDGHCRAFDAKAKGTVAGNGVSIVVLKMLEQAIADGDYIHAVIKGYAINNDGFLKVGYTAPSVEGQAAVISEAQAFADIEAETISYIEAHGTGTELGDPIEITALTKAFCATTEKKGFCAIGSLKTNIGHTDTAAGVAGLIKTVLALKHRSLPPSLHFEQPNPQIDFANSPFYVNSALSEWKSNGSPRRAGVSSFGIGGTNAHVILEEAPALEPSGPSRPWQLLVLSAKTPSALSTATANLAKYLAQHPDINLADVAYTLHCGRQSFKHRRMLVCQDTQEAATALRTLDPACVFAYFQPIENRPVVFMFSGQGTQYVNMGLELYQHEPSFQKQVDLCSQYLKPHLGLDIREVLYPSEEQIAEATQQINQTAITQTALFVIEYALAKLWMSYGIHPQAMIGHSIGEYVAACLADVFSLEDALSLVATRGQMMQSLPNGAMLAVLLPESEVQPLLHQGLSLAAINGPSRCVVSGPTKAIGTLQKQLTERGVECQHLHTSHAFHSGMINPILAPFTDRVKQVTLNEPQILYVSNITGTWITAAEATNPSYWATHLRQTVRFAGGLQTLLEDSTRILLEVGPGRTLTTLAKQHPDKVVAEHSVLSSLRHPQDNQSDVAFLLNTLGQLWLVGGFVDWTGFYANERRQRLPLPTYPFDRQRYWIEPLSNHQSSQAESSPITAQKAEPTVLHSRSDLLKTYVAPRNRLEQTIADIWSKALGIEQFSIFDKFFDLGGDSLLAVQVIAKLRDTLQIELDAHSLLNKSTIIALAELIEEKKPKSSSQPIQQTLPSCLVTIQTGNTLTPPLFLMHPVGGHVYFYRDMAEQLGAERPIYGLQAQGVDGKTEPFTQVEEMATHYIKALRILQPEGPYFLGGASFGGTLAFEMAQQFHALGQKVALLAMIDTPGLGHMPVVLNDDAEILAYMLELGYDISVSVEELRQLELDEQLDHCVKQIEMTNKERPDLDLTHLHTVLKLFKTNSKAMRDYTPKIYPGKILFFRAKERDAFLSQNPELAWIDLALEGIEVHIVPGNHITMSSLPNVRFLAKRLKICLEQTKTDYVK
jgi:thioesterase domain-containing protein/malonyl CoA-acyl carrier protein transacylase/acyl carrier protein